MKIPEKITEKHLLALTAVLFWNLGVQYLLSTRDFEISDEDKKFVRSYIIYGYIPLGGVVLAFVISLLSFFVPLVAWGYAIFLILIVTFLSVILGVIAIFSDKQVLHYDQTGSIYFQQVSISDKNVWSVYIPIYNFYTWYKLGYQQENSLFVRESIVIWTFYVLQKIIFMNPFFDVILIMIILLRVFTLIGGIDVFYSKSKYVLDLLFTKNSEEIAAYIKASLIYLWEIFIEKKNDADLFKVLYDKIRLEYSETFEFTNTEIKKEYIVVSMLFILLLMWSLWSQNGMWFVYLYVGARFILMFVFKKGPVVPGIHELLQLLNKKKDLSTNTTQGNSQKN